MRKPIVALGLCLSTSLGVIPAADVLAATPTGSTLSSTPPSSSLPASSSTYRQSSGVSGAAIVQTAMKYIGYPYTATGDSPSTGFSCIGFVSYVYRQNGIPLPGDLQDAYAYAPKVAFSDLEPGDVLFFQNTVWPGISHAAIYIGGGRFIHSEWYGVGVRISSFTNDPKDYNYWIGKYLGANRPWTGAASAAVATPSPTSGATVTATPTVTPPVHLASGPSAVITVSVNVRSGPGMKHPVQTVAAQGTSVVVLRRSGGWYRVQLPDGTVGWIVAAGIGRSATVNTRTSTRSKSAAPTVGNPIAPARQGTHVQSSRLTARVQANGLRVHRSPSLAATVVTSLPRGERLQVLARSNGWVKIRLANGTTGWVSAAYVSSRAAPASNTRDVSYTPAATVTKRVTRRVVKTTRLSTARVAINVHTGPSLDDAVATVLVPGAGYRVIGWFHGWAHVVLANGRSGWVSGSVMRGAPTAYASYTTRAVKRTSRSRTTVFAGHVLTAGVRIHSAPGIKSPVTGLVAAGTHVRILGSRSGWDLVRLPNGKTGYVDGIYVR